MSLFSEAMSSAMTGYNMEGIFFHLSNSVSSATSNDAADMNDCPDTIPFHDFATKSPDNMETPQYQQQQQQQMTAMTLMILLGLSEVFVIFICRLLSNYHDAFYSQYRAEDLAFFLSIINVSEQRTNNNSNNRSSSDASLMKRKEVVESVLVHEMFHRRRKTNRNLLKENMDQKQTDSVRRLSLTCFECDDASEESCPICLVDYEDGDCICHTQTCNHSFHADCLTKWLMKNDTCPYCRTNAFSSSSLTQKNQQQQQEEDNSNNEHESNDGLVATTTTTTTTTTMAVSRGAQVERNGDTNIASPETTNTESQPLSQQLTRRSSSLLSAFTSPPPPPVLGGTSIIDRDAAVTISRQSSFVTLQTTMDNEESNNDDGGGLFAAETAAALDGLFMFF